jgi:hypothetical protein
VRRECTARRAGLVISWKCGGAAVEKSRATRCMMKLKSFPLLYNWHNRRINTETPESGTCTARTLAAARQPRRAKPNATTKERKRKQMPQDTKASTCVQTHSCHPGHFSFGRVPRCDAGVPKTRSSPSCPAQSLGRAEQALYVDIEAQRLGHRDCCPPLADQGLGGKNYDELISS